MAAVTGALAAPFPWFGGKSRAAGLIWPRLGEVHNYVEPFAGSLAVLLARPEKPAGAPERTETVNDLDGFIANFWRAVSHDPEAVARYADWPVNEVDLLARHVWLVNRRDELSARLMGDPDYYDAKIAGWWVWGASMWIGNGWCSGKGPWTSEDGLLVRRDGPENGVHRKRPHLTTGGKGVQRNSSHPSASGNGVKRNIPRLSGASSGVQRNIPLVGTGERALTRAAATTRWFEDLAQRLRRVRVVCGDWKRVSTPAVMAGSWKTVGVLLDPPYDRGIRDNRVYATDASGISDAVREWALSVGDDPRYRIALCGYEGEHDMPPSWECVPWKANGGYGNQGARRGAENKHKERIWFSPGCLRPETNQQGVMFE